MSIRDFNKLFMSKGCVFALSGILLLVMAIGFLMSGSFGGRGQQSEDSQKAQTVVTIAGLPVGAEEIEKIAQEGFQNGTPPGPRELVAAYGGALNQYMTMAYANVEAKNKGIVITDDQLIKQADQSLEMQLFQMRYQLMQAGKLKQTATDKDFDDALKAQTGKTSAEIKAEQDKQLREKIKDKSFREQLLASSASTLVPQAMADKITVTDDQLKASYVTISAKRIFLTGADAKSQADKVAAEIKPGVSFESLVDRYTKDTPAKGKKASETVVSLTHDQLVGPPYADLAALKAGDVSKPLNMGTGYAIYKILSVKQELPKDFDKTKDTLKKSFAQQQATATYQKDIADLIKTGADLVWKSKGWKTIYDYSVIETAGMLQPDDRKQKLQALADSAKAAATDKEDFGQRQAALTYYVAMDDLYTAANDKDKPALADRLVEAITGVSDVAGTPAIEIELAGIQAQKKDGAAVVGALSKAADMNVDFEQMGQGVYNQINADVTKYQKQGVLTDDMVKAIDQAQAAWRDKKKTYDTQKAETLKQQKEAEDAQKAQMAKDKAAYEKAQKEAKEKQANEPAVPRDQLPANKTTAGATGGTGATTGTTAGSSSPSAGSVLGGPQGKP